MNLPVLLLAALLSPPSSPDYGFDAATPASEARLSSRYRECVEYQASRNMGMLACAQDEMALQDKRLNLAYRGATNRLGARGRVTLRNLERAWIRDHEAACARASGVPWTGSDGELFYAECLLHEIVKRTIWLERYRG